MSRLPRSFFARPSTEVAPVLLNKVLVAPGVRGRIVETEAYTGSDDPGAVLIRAVTPLDGVERMRERRPKARRTLDLTNGPAKLASAFGLDGSHDGIDLQRNTSGVRIIDDGTPPPSVPDQGVRVGLTRGADIPWRWSVPGCPEVSRPRPTMPGR